MAKRLIDANELYEKAENTYKGASGFYRPIYRGFVDMVADAPTVDAVEVCYCKDCKYARPLNDREKLMYLDECKVCYNGDATIDGYNIVMPEHFCSYGERRCE